MVLRVNVDEINRLRLQNPSWSLTRLRRAAQWVEFDRRWATEVAGTAPTALTVLLYDLAEELLREGD